MNIKKYYIQAYYFKTAEKTEMRNLERNQRRGEKTLPTERINNHCCSLLIRNNASKKSLEGKHLQEPHSLPPPTNLEFYTQQNYPSKGNKKYFLRLIKININLQKTYCSRNVEKSPLGRKKTRCYQLNVCVPSKILMLKL